MNVSNKADFTRDSSYPIRVTITEHTGTYTIVRLELYRESRHYDGKWRKYTRGYGVVTG